MLYEVITKQQRIGQQAQGVGRQIPEGERPIRQKVLHDLDQQTVGKERQQLGRPPCPARPGEVEQQGEGEKRGAVRITSYNVCYTKLLRAGDMIGTRASG